MDFYAMSCNADKTSFHELLLLFGFAQLMRNHVLFHLSVTTIDYDYCRGALHKIGRFRNVPTVGTFVNKIKNKFINKRTYGRYVSETTYFM